MVTFSSSVPAAANPASSTYTIQPGSRTVMAKINTPASLADETFVTINATANGKTVSKQLDVIVY